MANTDNNVIELSISEASPYLERSANEDIIPGQLVELWTNNKFRKHEAEADTAAPLFAVADIYSGRTINDTYAAEDKCYVRHCRSGDLVLAWMGASQTCSIGDYLIPYLNGYLMRKNATLITPLGPNSIVAIALEAIGDTGVPERVRVEIL
jgi:hypothetical protein